MTQHADGSAIVLPGCDGYGAQLCTVSYALASSPYFEGTAFRHGGYLKAVMSFTGAPSKNGISSWANDAESTAGGSAGDLTLRQWPQQHRYGSWIEVYFEFNSGTATQFRVGLHNRYGMPAATQDVNTGPVSGSPVSVPSGTDWAQPNEYGWLWVPATATWRGYCRRFDDQSPIGTTIEWDAWTPTQQPASQLGSTAFNVLDKCHLACILGSGDEANPAPLHSMEVWQSSAAGNLVL